MHGPQLTRREHGLVVARVLLHFVLHSQLLQEPEDALRARALEMVDGQHRPQCRPDSKTKGGEGTDWPLLRSFAFAGLLLAFRRSTRQSALSTSDFRSDQSLSTLAFVLSNWSAVAFSIAVTSAPNAERCVRICVRRASRSV